VADRAGRQPEFTGPAAAQGLIELEPEAPSAQPVVIPGVDHHAGEYLSRWRFLLVVAGVWLVAAAAGLGLYYWWFHEADKAMPVFAVLVYLVSCAVGALLSAMVQNRPTVAATAIALMSAPFASSVAAAVLYAGYAFGWITR